MAELSLRAGWLPGLCAICGSWQMQVICSDCLRREGRLSPRCPRCAARLPAGADLCAGCAREAPQQSSSVAAVSYEAPWAQLIAQMKFQDRAPLVRPMAQLLAFAIRHAGGPLPQALLPLPTTRARCIERGADLPALLARALGRELRLPVWDDLIVRQRDAPAQRTLDRAQRQRNVRGAFSVRAPGAEPLMGARVALVDDVMTTGATCGEATRCLLDAGAQEVRVWVLARTEYPHLYAGRA